MKRGVILMETSGATRDAVIALGHECLSVDVLPHQHGGPHHQGDVFEWVRNNPAPDFAVAHPDCTYLTGSAEWAYKDPDFVRYPSAGYHQRLKPETLFGADRRAAREKSEADARRIRYFPFKKAIENPVGALSRSHNLGKPHQIVQPNQFGSDASKATCFWYFDEDGRPMDIQLRISPADYVKPRMWCRACNTCSPYDAAFGPGCLFCGAEAGSLLPRWSNQTNSGQNRVSPGTENRWQVRSDTYPGIARALAELMVSL